MPFAVAEPATSTHLPARPTIGLVPPPGSPDRGTYVNYADADLVRWQQAYYGGPNYARLQRVKGLVDGGGLFGRFPQAVELPPSP